MNLKDIKTLSELSKDKGIKVRTLTRTIEKLIKSGELIEYEHYRKIEGRNQPYLLSKEGAEKIINWRGKE